MVAAGWGGPGTSRHKPRGPGRDPERSMSLGGTEYLSAN